MTNRIHQILTALLLAALFFGVVGLQAAPAYAQGGTTIFMPLAISQSNDEISGSTYGNPIQVSGNPSCADLNDAHVSITSDYGFKVDGVPEEGRTYYFTNNDGELTGGAPSDPSNYVTFPDVNNPSFTWSASLGIDAVIVKGGSNSGANIYFYSPESMGAGPLGTASGQSISHVEFCYDYEPEVSKTATATYDKTYTWDIDKTVDPTAQSGFAGDPFSYKWTVTLSKSWQIGNRKITGQITVKNPNPSAPVTGTLIDYLNDAGNTQGVISSCTGGTLSGNQLTVPAGGTAVCDYTVSPSSTSASKNTAEFIVSGNHYKGEKTFTWTPNVINGTVTVDDDQNEVDFPVDVNAADGGPWTWEYTDNYTCSTDKEDYNAQGTYEFEDMNTATVKQGTTLLDSDYADTYIDCYMPSVTKTANGLYDVRHTWDIIKSVDPASQGGFAGDVLPWTWTVDVSETSAEENYRVSGTISVYNPADIALTVEVADALSGGMAATVDCGSGATSLTVAAGQTGTCSYSATPTGKTAKNTATATYKTLEFSDTVDVVWSLDKVINGTATVTDNEIGLNEVLNANGGPWHYTSSDSHTCSDDLGDYDVDGSYSAKVDNTATVTGSDDQSDSDQATTEYFCYAPVVSKTAVANYDEVHTWTIAKSVDPTLQSGFIGDVLPWTWTVDVSESSADANFAVTGVISVKNPNPDAAMTVSVADVLNDGTLAAVDCDANTGGDQIELTVAAGQTGTCDYSAKPAGKTATLNTAAATIKTLSVTGTAAVNFVKNVVNGTATVTDGQIGLNADLTAGEGPWHYTSPDSHICSTDTTKYDANGTYPYTEDNVALIKNASGETLGEAKASTTVNCYVPSIEKTAAGTYDLRHTWDIEKSVDPIKQSAFAGDAVNFEWTVTLTENEIAQNHSVAGKITVINPNPEDELSVALADVLEDNTPVVFGACVGGTLVAGQLTVPADGSAVCDYSASPADTAATKNTATITLNGISFSDEAAVGWTMNDLGPAQVVVDDDQNMVDFPTGLLSAGGSWTYADSYTCSSDKGAYNASGTYAYTELNLAQVKAGETLLDESSASTAVDCYIPSITKTAAGSHTLAHEWEIEKTVSPLQQSAFAGNSVNFEWTVTLVEIESAESFAIAGTVTVANPNPEDALVVTLADTLDDNTPVVFGACVGGTLAGDQLTVPAGGSAACDYSASPTDATATKNTATISLNQIVFSAEATVGWTVQDLGLAEVTVDDDQYASFPQLVSAGDTWTYPDSYTCSSDVALYADDGVYEYNESNLAVVRNGETILDQDDASTLVKCYALVATKTAQAEWQREYTWTITKSVEPAAHSGFPGDTFESLYTVAVERTVTDSSFKAFGTILVKNPAGSPGDMTVDVSDQVDGTAATVDCDQNTAGDQGSLTVPEGETKSCTYQMALLDATDRTNTATVAFNQINFTASAAVDFGDPIVKGLPTINVKDFFNGDLVGEALGSASGDESFTYTRPFECPVESGEYTSGIYEAGFPNVARIVETEQEDDANVTVNCELKAGLGDRVWFDANQNGQQDNGEVGIAGVKVELLQNGNVIASKNTDASGNYSFTGLQPGTYSVRFPTTGLTAANQGNDASDSDADPTTGTTTTTLDAGEYDPTLDAGYLPAALGDRVWTDTDKNGLQDPGEPGISGVVVELLQNGVVIDTTTTGDDGIYHFTGLKAGAYVVRFPTLNLTDPNKGDPSNDSNPDKTGGETSKTLNWGEVDNTLDAGYVPVAVVLGKLGDFVWEDKNEDGIQNDANSGVGGVKVTLKQGENDIATTTTSSTGFYLFDNLEAGEYVVCFERPADFDFTDLDGPIDGPNDDGKDSDAGADGCTTTITLDAGETDLTWDAGLVDTTPTAEEEEEQPGRSIIFLPSLQTSTDGAAVQATVASVNPQDMQQEMYLPTLQGD